MKHEPGAGRRPGARSGAILALLAFSLATGCNCDPTSPGGEGLTDAGLLVSTPPDGGLGDAGLPDGGEGPLPDGGPADAGPPDAGPPDAGPPDGGPADAGALPVNGALDPTFGAGGWTSQARSPGKALALQPDGKLVVAGGTVLSRYLPDGRPDPGFGSGGTVSVLTQVSGFDALEAVAVQPDGRIVVAGHLTTATGDDWLLARCEADGRLDPTFGAGGTVHTDFAGSSDRAFAVLVQPDGRLVAAGTATYGTAAQPDSDFAVARYLADGTLDPSFGTGGKAHANLAGRADLAAAAALQPDGRVVVVGRVAPDGGSDPDFGAARFDAAGGLDPTFGTAGVVRVNLGGGWDEATDVAVQADGKLVLSGFARVGSTFRFALLRLDALGAPDPGFGTGGSVTAPLSTGNDYGRAVALQADGKVVVAGQAATSAGDFGLARFTTAGALDPTFGSGGVVTVDFFAAIDGALDLAVQPDGRLVVVGAARSGGSTGLGLARLAP